MGLGLGVQFTTAGGAVRKNRASPDPVQGVLLKLPQPAGQGGHLGTACFFFPFVHFRAVCLCVTELATACI